MSTQAVIRWTREADGSYVKEGNLPGGGRLCCVRDEKCSFGLAHWLLREKKLGRFAPHGGFCATIRRRGFHNASQESSRRSRSTSFR
jgi:hypothetical protein